MADGWDGGDGMSDLEKARTEFDAKKWLVIGGVAVSVGMVGALFALAIAIGGVCATACLIVLRSMWRDAQGKSRR